MNHNLRRVLSSTTLWCSMLLLGSQVAYAQSEGEGGDDAMSQADMLFEQLEEVVVIGYGTQKKKDLTGSSAQVSAEDFNGGVVTSPELLIQGKAAGITITPTNGEPGGGVSVRVRGGTSISSSNEPLYVIDGMPIQSANKYVHRKNFIIRSNRNYCSVTSIN